MPERLNQRFVAVRRLEIASVDIEVVTIDDGTLIVHILERRAAGERGFPDLLDALCECNLLQAAAVAEGKDTDIRDAVRKGYLLQIGASDECAAADIRQTVRQCDLFDLVAQIIPRRQILQKAPHIARSGDLQFAGAFVERPGQVVAAFR